MLWSQANTHSFQKEKVMTMIINDENIQEPADIKEGDTVNISCSAQSNPPKVMFKWYIEDIIEYDKVIDGDTEDQTSLLHITGTVAVCISIQFHCLGRDWQEHEREECEVLGEQQDTEQAVRDGGGPHAQCAL